jgi:hypothetical protein
MLQWGEHRIPRNPLSKQGVQLVDTSDLPDAHDMEELRLKIQYE